MAVLKEEKEKDEGKPASEEDVRRRTVSEEARPNVGTGAAPQKRKGDSMDPSEESPKDAAQRRMFEAVWSDSLPDLEKALAEGADPLGTLPMDSDTALVYAASRGRLAMLEALLPLSDPKAEGSMALRSAATGGYIGCLRALLPVSDPKAGNSAALTMAAYGGHLECLRALLSVSDPKAENSAALKWAAERGHAECVRALLPVSDPKAQGSEALLSAAAAGRIECVKLLLPASGPEAGIKALRKAALAGSLECVEELLPVLRSGTEADGMFARHLAKSARGCGHEAAAARIEAYALAMEESRLFEEASGPAERKARPRL